MRVCHGVAVVFDDPNLMRPAEQMGCSAAAAVDPIRKSAVPSEVEA